MDKDKILRINRERLEAWASDLANAHATPALLLGIGHDHASGEIHMCIPEDLPPAAIVGFLRKAVRDLENGQGIKIQKTN